MLTRLNGVMLTNCSVTFLLTFSLFPKRVLVLLDDQLLQPLLFHRRSLCLKPLCDKRSHVMLTLHREFGCFLIALEGFYDCLTVRIA